MNSNFISCNSYLLCIKWRNMWKLALMCINCRIRFQLDWKMNNLTTRWPQLTLYGCCSYMLAQKYTSLYYFYAFVFLMLSPQFLAFTDHCVHLQIIFTYLSVCSVCDSVWCIYITEWTSLASSQQLLLYAWRWFSISQSLAGVLHSRAYLSDNRRDIVDIWMFGAHTVSSETQVCDGHSCHLSVFKQKLKMHLFGFACSWDCGTLWLFVFCVLYKYSMYVCMYVCNWVVLVS